MSPSPPYKALSEAEKRDGICGTQALSQASLLDRPERREHRRALWNQLEEHYDATLEKHCRLWERKRGVKVSISTMSRAIVRLGWTLKKRVWVPPNETKKREVLGEMR